MVSGEYDMSQVKSPITVAVSMSDSPDIQPLGLSEGHLKEAIAELALQLLAIDVNLAYGGDLRTYGFTKLLFRLVLRYTSIADLRESTVRVTNYLPWPVHIGTPLDEIDELVADLHGPAQVVLLECDGTPLAMDARRNLSTRVPSQDEWISGLTAMRKLQSSLTDARVLLGGQVENFKGRMPGVAEEALLSLRAGQPLFLIGGFGGCTRDVAETLGLVEPWDLSRNCWPSRSEFKQWTGEDLNNGLTTEENELLASTPYMSQIIVLILRGMHRLRQQRSHQIN